MRVSRYRMWVPPEVKEPVLLHHPTRESVWYYGLVRFQAGKFVEQREENVFNADTFWALLKQLRKASCHYVRKVYVILDNEKYHHARLHKQWRELYSSTFTHLFLPAYSPDLNQIERVWKLTRKFCIHNRYFSTLDHVIETQFNDWSKQSEDLRRLCVI